MPNILIIDDQLLLLDVLRMALEDYYEVRIAQSGLEAVEIMDHWPVDLVLTDYSMPGMSGIELIEYIVGAGSPRPRRIILYSACLDADLEQRALAAGADVCMAKPFDLGMLKNEIQKALKTENL